MDGTDCSFDFFFYLFAARPSAGGIKEVYRRFCDETKKNDPGCTSKVIKIRVLFPY